MTGEQLRMARAALKLGVRELSALANVDKMSIVGIENGRIRGHASTHEKLRRALEDAGIVFLDGDAEEYQPTVALRVGITPASSDPRLTDGNDAASKPDEGLSSRAWDEDFEEFGQSTGPNIPPMTDEERALMRQYYATHPDRWAKLSPLGKAVLARTMQL